MFTLASPEPVWLDLLPGVRVQFAPIGMKAVRAARRAVRTALGVDADDMETAGDALSAELIRRGILAWDGVGNSDGTPLGVSPEAIELFIADPRTFEAADRAYVLPWAARDAEGNGSSASPDGTGEKATPGSDTARSPAKPTNADDAKPARTRSTSRKPKKAPVAGK